MSGLVPFTRDLGLDNFFDNFFGSSLNTVNRKGVSFKMDISEEENSYRVEADMPGVNKEDINIAVNDKTLQISVKHEEKIDNSDKNNKYIHRERYFSSCSRSVYLGDIDESQISAKMENGVLIVNIPKLTKEEQSRQIEIK